MVLFDIDKKKDYFVSLKRTSGEESVPCPICSEDRKKKTIKCFSFNHDKQVGHCSHCNCKMVVKREFEPKKEYKKPPAWKNQTVLSDRLVKWFESRKIKQKTLLDFKISEGIEWMPQVFSTKLELHLGAGISEAEAKIKANEEAKVNTIQFNYFRDKELVNIKYRDGQKNHKLFSGAELIFYNLDAIKDSEKCIICEGEADAMAIHQSGFTYVVSVPNGAGLNKINFDFLDNCIEYFDNKTEILIATDNDVAGRNLQEQIAERLGKERCFKIVFKDCKDANDCLIKYDIQGIIESISDKQPFPLEGIFTWDDYEDNVNDIYENGLPKGAKTMMGNLNKLLSFHKGYITTVTGLPGSGKSDFVDQLTLQLALNADWKGAFYSPENKPTSLHISKLARKLIGKGWWGDGRITKDEIGLAKDFLNDRFFWIRPENDFTLDTILKHVKQLVLRKGIDFFVIDAFNKLEHKYEQNETKYIGECLDKMAVFCEDTKTHLFLVAHPTKTPKQKNSNKFEVPNLYSISGSANFFNKTDNGICVYRDYEDEVTRIYIQKVKFSFWGEVGNCEFKYDLISGRYNEYNGGALHSEDKSPWVYNEKTKPKSSKIEIPETDGIITNNYEEDPF